MLDKEFFKALVEDRIDSAKTLEKPSICGVIRSVVDKYSENAHFVYELLQNADDAKATYARFKLYHDRLIFAHNGKRRFSVSNPKTEGVDKKEGRLGDVNSILSIGLSSKIEPNKIGKFGIGFKAVFLYTSTPYIYDPEIKFRIERFIVPVLLNKDHAERLPEETLFEFPFNEDIKDSETAYEEISERLLSLVNPTLFLANLQEISFEFEGTRGCYGKKIEKDYKLDDIIAEKIVLTKKINDNLEDKKLWLLSRVDAKSGRYAVGFYLDEKENLIPTDEYAYCFFPTKTNTGLHFIIHAPFLLTDSREGIKANDKHNQKMIDLLSDLFADGISKLIEIGNKENHRLVDDKILKIVPIKSFNSTGLYGSGGYTSPFEPFYQKTLNAFKTRCIIPTVDSYTVCEKAYWASNSDLVHVFDDDVLGSLTKKKNAYWVFTSYPRHNMYPNDYAEMQFIDSIVASWMDENRILTTQYITSAFILERSIQWFEKFYKWIEETKSRMNKCKNLPIFISADDKAVPAYDSEDNLILFLPDGESNDYTYVNEKFLENEKIMEFVKAFGIKKPLLKDEIYTKIFPKLKEGGNFYSIPLFKKIFEYYIYECPEIEKEQYIETLKKYEFIRYSSEEKEGYYRGYPDTIYYPDECLKKYFSVKKSTRFVDLEEYNNLVGEENAKYLLDFLDKLGVSKRVRLINNEINPIAARNRSQYNWAISNGEDNWNETVIDGCTENLSSISDKGDVERSYLLWDYILDVIKNYGDLSVKLKGIHEYHWYKRRRESFSSINVTQLKKSKWLIDKKGNLVSPSETFVRNLSDRYDTTSNLANQFISFLGMPYDDPKMSRLTQEQKNAIELADELNEFGIKTKAELHEVLREFNQLKSKNRDYQEYDNGNSIQYDKSQYLGTKEGRHTTKHRNHITEIDEEIDNDEFIPKPIDFKKKIEKAKAKKDAEIDLIEQMEEMQKKALSSKRYSYGWFKALLDLEAQASDENVGNSKEISICFGKATLEGNTERTIILSQPSSYIPRFMEDLADIPLILEFEEETKKLPIEVISIRSFTLRVKLKPNVDISLISFEKIKEARITAENPVFLLEELKKQFLGLKLEDDFDMQKNLYKNIDFVFGPPGTGKTTYLAKDIIIPFMQQRENLKVLVLTPTNKAADVITKKIQEMMRGDISYTKWLVRFGSTDDEYIEKLELYKDKTYDLKGMEQSVVVTTIDRFPYDYFMQGSERHYIRNQKYDYIIFDEASMIPLIKIIFPLYYKQPRKFIIAGDPFQIEPVVHLDMWKNENIYTMVRLKSFSNPKTFPYNYDVKLLKEQFRSIPVIGDLVSKLTYDGVLKHHRLLSEQVLLDFGNGYEVKPLNIIKFPVSKYESIFRAKRLNGKTPYHIYSALFAYEFALWLADRINRYNPEKNVRIGVIAAYKAQADLIDRLIGSMKLPENILIKTGTIHGFQGDECEIIIDVYNPPPSISSKNEMFLNKKNIINVSISRARDYLFVIMPDNRTEKVENLILIKQMEEYIKESGAYTEYNSRDIEWLMFGNPNYLEENAFSTSHQNVNVYGLPEQTYEIRSEDNAIDIQVYKKV